VGGSAHYFPSASSSKQATLLRRAVSHSLCLFDFCADRRRLSGIPFVLVVTHCDSVVPLADLAAPSATSPLFEHAQMQPLIADVAARTGVNANQVSTGIGGGGEGSQSPSSRGRWGSSSCLNQPSVFLSVPPPFSNALPQIFPVANYSSQRRRQYALERNGVLALAQLAKQISEGRKFAPTAVPPPPPCPLPNPFTRLVRAPIPPVQKAGPVNGPVASASAAGAASKAAEENLWRPLLMQVQLKSHTPSSAAEVKGQPVLTQSQTSTSAAQPQPQPESQPMTEPAAPSAASSAIRLQLHLRAQSDDGERKESDAPLSAAPEQPAAGSPSETSRSVPPLLTATGPSSAPLVGSSPRSVRSSRSADSTGSDSSWDQWESPPPADAQQQRAN
jgi:hypothetical protein